MHRHINKSTREMTKKLTRKETKRSVIENIKAGLVDLSLESEGRT